MTVRIIAKLNLKPPYVVKPVHYLGYYTKWHPQDVYYYSVKNSNWELKNSKG